ncbi:MAG: LolA family protein [Candidatus Sericytochromatia bacterium]
MKVKNLLCVSIILLSSGCGGNSYNYPVSQPVYQYQPVSNQNLQTNQDCTCKSNTTSTNTTNKSSTSINSKANVSTTTKTTTEKKSTESSKNTSKTETKKEVSNEQKVQTVADELYYKAIAKMKSIDTFKTDLVNYNKGFYYKKEKVTEPKIALATMQIVFQRPRKTMMKIVEAPSAPSLINTKLYCDGGENVRIRVPGILGLFAFTFSVDKPDLTGNRGYNIKEIDAVNLELRLDDKNAKVKLTGTSKIEGEDVYLLEVTNIRHLDSEIIKEVIGIKKSDYSLILHEMYDKNEVVFRNEFKNFVYNIPVTEDDFKV